MAILPSEAMPLALAGILPELPQLLAVHNMRGRGRGTARRASPGWESSELRGSSVFLLSVAVWASQSCSWQPRQHSARRGRSKDRGESQRTLLPKICDVSLMLWKEGKVWKAARWAVQWVPPKEYGTFSVRDFLKSKPCKFKSRKVG